MRPIPLGIDDFRLLREQGMEYIDKSHLIREVLDQGSQVLLLPRPRRFGKTINLSMLRCFFDKSDEDRSSLFSGLSIAQAGEHYQAHFQRYPVLSLTFKDIKADTWEAAQEGLRKKIEILFREHIELLERDHLSAWEARDFRAILDGVASATLYDRALLDLSTYLHRRHGERVVILIDEYDAPIHAGWSHGYVDEALGFFRVFLGAGLKGNPHLFKAVLTGILRIAKESIFSGLNNISVYSMLRSEFSTSFGFTEPEVRRLVEERGLPELFDDIRAYYNGYLFGREAIYNPWSVLCFLGSADKELLPYWIDTSSNDLVRELLLTGPGGVRAELEVLLLGGTIDKPIDENIVLRDLSTDADAVWSFLLFTGYLKPVEATVLEGRRWAKLGVPNAEVAIALQRMAQGWMVAQVGGADDLRRLLAALLRGDARVVERYLSHMAKVNLSYFDTAGPEPERFYHGLVVGLLAGLGSRYEVRSNRESGFGRCDVMVLPKAAGQPGVVMELKRVDAEEGETPEKAIVAALEQIRARDYAAELRERGASPIHEMAAVFDGKRAYVRLA